ncbi:DUF948 domain-containing protein [Intestinibacter sp.]|uniref:DUF948 domain-containing protein n=1 Tax=Intestinibacter sp. TaxID=1965304 RepID=UPI003F1878CE
MKNKFFILCLTSLMVLGMVGCARRNNNEAPNNNTTVQEETRNNANQNGAVDNQYYDIYTKNYNASLAPLEQNYTMYGNLNTVEEYYKTNKYPGNKKYLEEVKKALKDSRDNVEKFVDSMEKDAKSTNNEVERLNREMIDDGRDLIEDIDERIQKLDRITDQDLNRSETEFRRLIGEQIMLDDYGENDFRDMLRNLERTLGIDRDNVNTNNTKTNNK